MVYGQLRPCHLLQSCLVAVHGIIGLAELLFQSLTQPEAAQEHSGAALIAHSEQLEYCSAILDSAKLLQSLVTDVLDFSKVGSDDCRQPHV